MRHFIGYIIWISAEDWETIKDWCSIVLATLTTAVSLFSPVMHAITWILTVIFLIVRIKHYIKAHKEKIP